MIAKIFFAAGLLLSLPGCNSNVKEKEDQIYSRHLQRHVNLKIITTPLPAEKSEMNLLLLNYTADLKNINIKKIIDSLTGKKLIRPLMAVEIFGDEHTDYGVNNLPAADIGNKADKYSSFIINELYPFIKKKSGIRKFHTLAICGFSSGAASAFEIAWENSDKINKVGVISPDFTGAGNNPNAFPNEITHSRKKPKLQYWFYVPVNADSDIAQNTKGLINVITKKNTAIADDIKFISGDPSINDANAFTSFLVWAFAM